MKDAVDTNQQVIRLYFHLRKQFDQLVFQRILFFKADSFQDLSHAVFILIENALHVFKVRLLF